VTLHKMLIGRLGIMVSSVSLRISMTPNHFFLTSLSLAIMCLVCSYSNYKDLVVQFVSGEIPASCHNDLQTVAIAMFWCTA
jgi:hypothetical protein